MRFRCSKTTKYFQLILIADQCRHQIFATCATHPTIETAIRFDIDVTNCLLSYRWCILPDLPCHTEEDRLVGNPVLLSGLSETIILMDLLTWIIPAFQASIAQLLLQLIFIFTVYLNRFLSFFYDLHCQTHLHKTFRMLPTFMVLTGSQMHITCSK